MTTHTDTLASIVKQQLLQKQGIICALFAAFIWSGFILISRQGGISALNEYDVIAIRYLTCSVLLLPFWWFKYRFNFLQVRFIFASLIGGLGYALFTFRGFQLASASHAAVLLPGLIPLFIIFLAAVFERDKVSFNKWLGIGLIALGVCSLIWPLLSTTNGLHSGHYSLAAGAFCWALFSVLIKRWQITPWQATVSLAFITCIIYLPIYLALLPKNIALQFLPDIALQVFYQGFMATIVQMILYVKAVRLIGPCAMGSVMAVVPLISGLGAVYWFAEPLTSTLIIGLISVSLGAVIVHTKLQLFKSK